MHYLSITLGNNQIKESAFHQKYSSIKNGELVFDCADYIEEKKIRLFVSKVNAHVVHDDILKSDFNVIDLEPTDQYVEFYKETGEIVFHNTSAEFISEILKNGQQMDDESSCACWTFIMTVIRHKNLFVYAMFSTPIDENYNTQVVIANIMKHIENIEIFEKLAKANGSTLLFKNIGQMEFNLDAGAKKLKKAIGIPDEVKAYIKTEKIEETFSYFQTFSKNPNDSKDLVAYLRVLKKLSPYHRYDLLRFVQVLAKLTESIDTPFRTILNHLIRENWFFNKVSLPVNEASRWMDCVDMAKSSNLQLPPTFQNIKKYHNILAKNVDILKNPRTEEFKEAVSLYSRLAKEIDGYIIRPPKDEFELLEEGTMLHHCVASYRDKIIDDKAIVLFCRKAEEPDVPLFTIELEYTPGDTSFTVSQFKQLYDADVTDKAMLKVLSNYLDSRRYIIEGGKNLFRKPRVIKAKKGEPTDDEV